MPDRPELPTSFAHKSSVYNVLPDIKPMTWGVWDLDGCFGEVTLDAGMWTAHLIPIDPMRDPVRVATWQEAVAELVRNRPYAAA